MEARKHSRAHLRRKMDRLTAGDGKELGFGYGIGVVK
jgi:hypothetical protein